jgi:hypothetical protein
MSQGIPPDSSGTPPQKNTNGTVPTSADNHDYTKPRFPQTIVSAGWVGKELGFTIYDIPSEAYYETPGGLSEEWEKVWRDITLPAYTAYGFSIGSLDSPDLLPPEELAEYDKELLRHSDLAYKVIRYLHGRAPRTWIASLQLSDAVDQILIALQPPFPEAWKKLPEKPAAMKKRMLWENLYPEEVVAINRRLQAEWCKFHKFNATPLLANLAAAVTSECGGHLGLESKKTPSTNQVTEPGPLGWSSAEPPSEWERVFHCCWRTILRRMRGKKVRFLKLSTKSYKIAIDDIPGPHQERFRSK